MENPRFPNQRQIARLPQFSMGALYDFDPSLLLDCDDEFAERSIRYLAEESNDGE